MHVTYRPEVFDTPDEAAARAIILTPTAELSTEQRWAIETPYLARRITALLQLDASDTVIDFGCGIGRLSKALIESTGCAVVGVDISEPMRQMAVRYVGSERFRAISPDELDAMVQSGWRAEAAFACWVLQHCPNVDGEIRRIISALRPASDFVLVNTDGTQVIPVDAGWMWQSLDIRAKMRQYAIEISTETLPPEINTEQAYMGLYLTPGATPTPRLWSRLRRLFS